MEIQPISEKSLTTKAYYYKAKCLKKLGQAPEAVLYYE